MGLALDTESPESVPYFNWDAPVTNAEVRRVLAEGDEESRLFWIARIMTEARYDHVWRYVSLRKDVRPRWSLLRTRLGRRRELWELLIDRWQRLGLISLP